MRQLVVQSPRGRGPDVLAQAQSLGGRNLACWQASSPGGPTDVALIHIANDDVERLLAGLESAPDCQITLIPRGNLVLTPPSDQASEQVTDAALRSPVEIFLAGLQSVGSWKGFIGYAASNLPITNRMKAIASDQLIARRRQGRN